MPKTQLGRVQDSGGKGEEVPGWPGGESSSVNLSIPNPSPTQAETNSIVFAQSQGKFLIEMQTKEIMTGGLREM